MDLGTVEFQGSVGQSVRSVHPLRDSEREDRTLWEETLQIGTATDVFRHVCRL